VYYLAQNLANSKGLTTMALQMLPSTQTRAIVKGSDMELVRRSYSAPNAADVARSASVIAGSLLTYYGVRQKSWSGAGLAVVGLGLLGGGVKGSRSWFPRVHQPGESRGGNRTIPYETGIRIDEAITINLPRQEVYEFWRDPGNLAEFMEHVESVRPVAAEPGSGTSDSSAARLTHWVAKGPGGRRMEWDAEIINEIQSELIAWRSLPGSEVANAGSVNFADAPGGRGTEVRIALQYNPPGGAVGALVARLFGEEPSVQIHHDLMRLKTQMETGEVPTIKGQPSGARKKAAEQELHKKSERVAELVVTASEASFPASDAPAYTH
jgi:uncharacterized membrane protein